MKGKIIPITFTVLIIIIFIYFFASIKQPIVVCDKVLEDDLGIVVFEELSTTIDGDDIDSMKLVKTITISNKYINDIDNIIFRLKKAYAYLDDAVSIVTEENKIVIVIEILDYDTIILDNISFYEDNGLIINVNSNTKSNDVVALKIGEEYTEGELMTRLKNKGYSCR